RRAIGGLGQDLACRGPGGQTALRPDREAAEVRGCGPGTVHHREGADMALRRRKGSPYWHYDFTVQGRRFRGSTETPSRADAEIIEAQLRRDALLGKILERKPRLTLDQAFGRYWMEHAFRLPGAKTVEYQIANLKALPTSAWLDDLGDSDVAK